MDTFERCAILLVCGMLIAAIPIGVVCLVKLAFGG